MSRENVEEFRRGLKAFNRTVTDGDAEDFFESLDEEVEWVPITAFLDGATYRGKDGVREWMDELRRDWEIYELTWEEVRDLGDDRVLAIGRWHAQGRRSGVELRLQEAAWLVRYRNGKLLRLETFTDRNKALEAVGLSE
jgi:ketosteroid isomerase-like protein